MKKNIILGLFIMTLFAYCTPKVGDATSKTDDVVTTPTTTILDDFRNQAPAPGPAPTIEMGTYENFKLDNGLQVIVVENHKIPQVSFQLFVDSPDMIQGEYAGYTSLAGQLLNKGTKTRNKAQLDEEVDYMGATLNTNENGLFASSLKKHTPKLLELMADVLKNPTFPQAEFDKIKKQTLSALAQAKEDPSSIAANVANVLRYGKDHPYGEIETEATIEKITLDKCKEYYNTYMKPNISYLVVVGDVTPDEAKTMVDKYFSDWKASANIQRPSFKMPEAPDGAQLDFVNKSGAVQSVLRLTYPVDFKPGGEDAIKASVMNTILGGYFRSRLNGNLREDKAYTYGVGSGLISDKNVGYFTASGSVRNEVTDSAIVEFNKEFSKLINEPVGADELSLVKNYMSGSFARSLESPQTVARFALNTIRYNLPSDYYKTYLGKLSAVTSQDVQAMAKKYIKPDNMHIIVVGNKDEVADKLAKFSANKKINYYDTYGNEVKMDGVNIPAGTTAETVLADYLEAIGGPAKLKAVKSLATVMNTSIQGQDIQMSVFQEAPNKFALKMEMKAMGMTMQEEIFNGTKAKVTAQGPAGPQTQVVEDEEGIAEYKNRATMFPEMYYKERGYKLELKGVEQIEGVNAYKILVENPKGEKSTEFYDMKTSYKISEVRTQQQGPQTITITTNTSDYKDVDGVKIPHSMSLVGAAPFPLNFKAESIKINSQIDPATFKVD